MAVTTVTNLSYPITDTLNDDVNSPILKQELEDETLSVSVGNVELIGTTILIELLGDASSSDITAVTGVVEAHAGDDFVEVPLTEIAVSETSDDSGSEITKVTMTTGALPAGSYTIIWHMEHKVNTNTGNTASRATLYYSKNGDTPSQFLQNNVILDQWVEFGSSYPIDVNDGDSWLFTLRHQRIGTSGNASHCRRGRIALVRASF